MASRGNKNTTMTKRARENRLRERRLSKQAKKQARKQAPSDDLDSPAGALHAPTTEAAEPRPGQALSNRSFSRSRSSIRDTPDQGVTRGIGLTST
jgi:hypothetical protein